MSGVARPDVDEKGNWTRIVSGHWSRQHWRKATLYTCISSSVAFTRLGATTTYIRVLEGTMLTLPQAPVPTTALAKLDQNSTLSPASITSIMDLFTPILFFFAPYNAEEEVRVEILEPVDAGGGGSGGGCIIA